MGSLKAIDHVLVSIPSDHVLVLVPKDRLAEVLALLERLSGEHGASAAAESDRPHQGTGSRAGEDQEQRWTPVDLKGFVDENPPPPIKQLVLLELLAQNAGKWVSAHEAQKRLKESGLAHPKYPGKALGGIVLSLKRRAGWYEKSVPLFDDDWDDGTNWYRLPEDHAGPLLEAIAQKRWSEPES